MSDSYNEEHTKITFIDVLLLFVPALIAVPLLPFLIAYIFLILKTNKKENYVIMTGIAVTAIMCSKISLFLEQAGNIAVALVKSILKGTFAITVYKNYCFSSWLLLIAISFIIASCAAKRIRHNYKLEAVGIHTLSRQY